jgi:hypothetical protein
VLSNVTKTVHDNLVPGMVTAIRWDVQSGTLGRVPTVVYTSYRPRDSEAGQGRGVLLAGT